MKLASEIIEALKSDDLDAVRQEVQSSFSLKELKSFKSFNDFFKAVDVQNGYEQGWKPNKWKPYYEQVWNEFKSGKLSPSESNCNPLNNLVPTEWERDGKELIDWIETQRPEIASMRYDKFLQIAKEKFPNLLEETIVKIYDKYIG